MTAVLRRIDAGPARGRVLLAAALLLAPLGCDRAAPSGATPDSARSAATPRPNLVLILIDTLRADRVGAVRDGRSLTPALDRLAAEGACFERVVAAAPWTLPSIASLLTGVYPDVHGVTAEGDSRGGGTLGLRPLSGSFITLQEALAAGGYATAAFSANPFVVPAHGFGQGFDSFHANAINDGGTAAALNAAACEWLDRRDPRKPFFLYVHYMEVHAPYTRDREFVDPFVQRVAESPERTWLTDDERNQKDGLFARSMAGFRRDPVHRELAHYREYWWARYDAGVALVDCAVAGLRDELSKRGLWQDTCMLVTADHGESLGEHGVWGHGRTLYQHGLLVPVVLRGPGVPAGARDREYTSLIDVYPTLLRLAGLEPPAAIQGRDLLSAPAAEATDRPLLAQAVRGRRGHHACIAGGWKLLAEPAAVGIQLFDLAADPGERRDLARLRSDQLQSMRQTLYDLLAECGMLRTAAPEQTLQLDAEQLRRLKALGYVGGDSDEPDEDGG